jgi:hypothetical protein
MGFFGQFRFSNGAWGSDSKEEPYLLIDVHDSDLASIEYAPVTGGASGRCFLGFEPRHYFDDPEANDPVDLALEVQALAEWARVATGAVVDTNSVQALLADPEGGVPAEPFLEETLVRLLDALELPIPAELQDGSVEVVLATGATPGGDAARQALHELGATEVTPETLGDFIRAVKKHLD